MSGLLDWAGRPGPAQVLAAARDRLERGLAGSAPLRVDLDDAERFAVSALLGLDWLTSNRPVTLPRLRSALPEGLTLEALLERVGGPLVDRRGAREAAMSARDDEARRARSVLAEVIGPELAEAVSQVCLPGRDPVPRAEQLAAVARRLPSDGGYLPALAADCFADAHALDRNRSLGQAAARLALILTGQPAPSGSLPAGQWRLAWAGVGVSCDRVSTTVLTLNLPLDGPPGLRAVTSVRGEPLWLTARQLADAQVPDPPPHAVFVCENPSVMETAADRLGAGCRPLVCTFGRPSQAAHQLLRVLHQAGVTLHVRADNDAAGRSFVDAMLRTAPSARRWRYERDASTYEEQVLSDLLDDLRGP